MPEFGAITGKRAVILGGMGFIGSNLARRLADLNTEVTVLDTLAPNSGGNPANLLGYEDRVRIVRGGICDPAVLQPALGGQEFVFNLAAQTSHLESMRDPNADLVVNVAGQLALLAACHAFCPAATEREVFKTVQSVAPEYKPDIQSSTGCRFPTNGWRGPTECLPCAYRPAGTRAADIHRRPARPGQ